MEQSSDRIEKQILLRAPRARVWKAITDAKEFGSWFGWELNGEFAEGATLTGKITIKGFEHLLAELTVERIQPQSLFAYRWHPNALDPEMDYSGEPTTRVAFELQERPEGTLLTVCESGFDQIPLARRAQAYRGNDQGWAAQVKNIEKHLAQTS
jgi:uncharacterized protein YndB with AHSA1/START domain